MKAFNGPRLEAPLKEQAARALAQRLQQAVQGRLAQGAVGGGALVSRAQTGRTGRRARSSRSGRWRRLRPGGFSPAGGEMIRAFPTNSTCGRSSSKLMAAVLTAQAKFSPMRRKFSRARARISAGDFSPPKHIVRLRIATRRCRPSTSRPPRPPRAPAAPPTSAAAPGGNSPAPRASR